MAEKATGKVEAASGKADLELAWTRILARAITDLVFRESVRKDPAAALKDAGVIAPDLAEAIKSLSPKFDDAMKLAEVLGSTSNATPGPVTGGCIGSVGTYGGTLGTAGCAGAAQGPSSGGCAGTFGTGGGGTFGTIGSISAAQGAQGPATGGCIGSIGSYGGTLGTAGTAGAAQGPVAGGTTGACFVPPGGCLGTFGSAGAAQGPVAGGCIGSIGTYGGTLGTAGTAGAAQGAVACGTFACTAACPCGPGFPPFFGDAGATISATRVGGGPVAGASSGTYATFSVTTPRMA